MLKYTHQPTSAMQIECKCGHTFGWHSKNGCEQCRYFGRDPICLHYQYGVIYDEIKAKYPDHEIVVYNNPKRYGSEYVALYKEGALYMEVEDLGREKRTVLKKIIKFEYETLKSETIHFILSYDAVRFFKRFLNAKIDASKGIQIPKPPSGMIWYNRISCEGYTVQGIKNLFKEVDDLFTPEEALDYKQKFLAVLEPVPRYERIEGRRHEFTCSHARSDDCDCWCGGKYHCLGLTRAKELKEKGILERTRS